ncbi:tail fiber protein [Methylobrevis pamukkalensis]|uniref:Bifunctional hemolysin/adenylate cyclase n=1 Tax=Methylobrevis pamukkalensis TaxID=1439726 RepID=A0A1E3H1V9_9HYPH|nr:tail fiber protein [Methylobrevis pamukkalensis]ODN70125.1 Bifunctional hemolysin/adenylate cyclase precursor [Methylobrevis pamukkalensis]
MSGTFSNIQPSLAITQFVPLGGVFPDYSGETSETGYYTMGMIRSFAGVFGPDGAPTASGQTYAIVQNTPLFSLFGANYGGNAQTTFGIPDLGGLVTIGTGQGPGLAQSILGDTYGSAEVTLTQANLAAELGGSEVPIDNVQPALAVQHLIRTGGSLPSEDFGAELFVGEVVKFAGTGVPEGYLACEGQILNIADFQALYVTIGNTYGGNGTTTFALPDLRGRSIVGATSLDPVGTKVGSATVTLTEANMPTAAGGNGAAFDNEAPGLTLTWLIALEGEFPSRDGNGSTDDSTPYVGEITAFAGDFAPEGWAICDGQVLSIAQNQTLFSVIGALYGGNGTTTFALPDLRGRTAVGTTEALPAGTVIGSSTNTLDMSDLPALSITGTLGDDTLYGGNLADTIGGSDGDDTIIGNGGADQMTGGKGNDVYVVDNPGDVATELLDEGTDTVEASVGYTLGDNVEDLLLTGGAAISGTGNALGNRLTGNAAVNLLSGLDGDDVLSGGQGDDILSGGAGADLLDGGTGADAMNGGQNNDTYIVDNLGDTVSEVGGNGTNDTVQSSVTFILGAGLEHLILTGNAAIDGTGNSSLNRIVGNNASNTLLGQSGNDTLLGNGGTDTLNGGSDNDKLFGGADADELFGDSGTDTLNGESGADLLDGGTGADAMFGGQNNDTYIVDNLGDTVSEDGGNGTNDTVKSSVSFTLGAGLEHLVLTGGGASDGTGNSGNNKLTGNDAANHLLGLGGNDTLTGNGGDDILEGGNGNDTLRGNIGNDVLNGGDNDDALFGGTNNDTLEGNSGSDTLYGEDGNDTLDGGDGADVLRGGKGKDVVTGGEGADAFVFDSAISASGNDTLTDFLTGFDHIELDDSAFTALTAGVALGGAFNLGAAASQADDRIIYDAVTGALRYDADGTGNGAAIQFATLSGAPSLSASDFVVV